VLLIVLTVATAVAIAWQQLAAEILRGWDNLKGASLFSSGFTGGPISATTFLVGVAVLSESNAQLDTGRILALMSASVWCTLPFALAWVWRSVRQVSETTAAEPLSLSRDQNKQLLAMAGTLLLLHVLSFGSEQLDIWIGGAALTSEQLGIYGVAKRSMMLAAMPVQMAILTVVGSIPRLCAQGRQRDLQNLLRGSAGLSAVPSAAALLILVLFPASTLQLLFGSSYAAAAPIIRIMAVGYLAFIFIGSANNLLILTGGHHIALAINVLAASYTGLVGPIAARNFGTVGLAWASTGALAMQCLLLWWLAQRSTGIWTHIGLLRLRSTLPLPIPTSFAAQSESA
jgi:O-antigen/teichoic acid export membrane protein